MTPRANDLEDRIKTAVDKLDGFGTALALANRDSENQKEALAALRRIFDGDGSTPGLKTELALMRQRLDLLWAILIVGGGAVLLAVVTTGVFWKAWIRAAME